MQNLPVMGRYKYSYTQHLLLADTLQNNMKACRFGVIIRNIYICADVLTGVLEDLTCIIYTVHEWIVHLFILSGCQL